MPLAPNQQLFEYCIVRILGRGTFGTVYLVMEYLAGGSLRTLLRERGPLLPTPYSLLPELPEGHLRACGMRQ